MKTLDSQAYVAAGASDPAWLAERRKTAYEYFDKLALPSPTEEVWRYVDLDFDLNDFGLAEEPGVAHEVGSGIAAALQSTAGSLLLVDGFTTEHQPGESPALFGPVAELAAAHGDTLEPYVGAGIPADLNKFAAAHHAFATDGAVLLVPAGKAVDVQAASDGTVSFPRITLITEESSQASVVIRYRSDDDHNTLVVPHLEFFVAANSTLKVTIVQHWGKATTAISHLRAAVGRDANLHLGEAGLGGAMSRLELNVDLEGDGSSANVVGAYFGDAAQTLDYRYTMHHQGLNTDSDMFLKGAVQDEALSVFTGMIRIDEEAQKTNAFQTNRNLILSDGASAQSVPNLEILANDVRCGHGSTMGPLDDEQRYYLMSRGLDEPRTNRLLVHGFFNEALGKFPEPVIADVVTSWIDAKYRAAQEAGRVA